MDVTVVETPDLGNRCYVVDDGSVGIVIDPQRDLDRLDLSGLTSVGLVLETHIHNDYVTGGLELARRTGAEYGVNAADPVAFDRLPLTDGQVLSVGTLRVTVIATPGHTDTHLAYLVESAGEPPVLFSGGSLLHGSVGRTDLLGADRARALGLAQLRTARRLGSLDPATRLFPTHGFGSFCATGSVSTAAGGTIGDELAANPVLRVDDEDAFVDALLAGLSAYPAYYAHMAPLNLAGPGAPRVAPLPLPPAALDRLLASGTVVDLRDAASYAADHLAGTLSVPLGDQLATYVGWLTPWGGQLALLAPTAADVEDARVRLARIGIEEVATASGPLDVVAPDRERGSFPRRTFAELATTLAADDVVLDVRRRDEYAEGRLSGALNIPLHELAERYGELPDRRLWVHCAGGFRAGIGASLLAGLGLDVVHVDDSFGNAVALGLAA
ncbi:rhodanese-like domain-containing protein [Nocardioides sp.]|uniref:rhodanese-like domain-containing protein n=1 Tax=Nocardioides sp. TaxID=35761 RepID=UPI0039E448CB